MHSTLGPLAYRRFDELADPVVATVLLLVLGPVLLTLVLAGARASPGWVGYDGSSWDNR